MTIEELQKQIEELIPKSAECERRNYDKLAYSNSYARQIEVLKEVIEFLSLPYDFDMEPYGQGTYIINDKYIIAARSRKWRVSGKNKWYRYKTPEQLINNYVYKECA